MKHFPIRIRLFLISGMVYFSLWAALSCGKKKSTEPNPENPAIDFNTEILPILQNRCNISGCHGGQTTADTAAGLVFSSFETMRQTAGQKTSWTKPLVIPGNPDSSHLVLTIRQSRPSVMPPSPLSPLSSTETNKIADWIKQGARGPGGKKFPTYREGKLYVANAGDGRLDIIDLSTNYRVDSISVTAAGENPSIVQTHHIAVSPDKKFIYVTNAWAFGHIIKIDAQTDVVLSRARAGFQPADIVVSPDGQYVYTTDFTSGLNVLSVVRQFNAQTLALVDTFPVGQAPHGIAISMDGGLVLTPSQVSDDCWFIYQAADSSLRLKLSPGVPQNPLMQSSYYGPMGVVFSSGDSVAYISGTNRRQICVINVNDRTVEDSIVLSPSSGNGPLMMAKSLDGGTLYAACLNSATLAMINLLTKDTTYIRIGEKAHAPALVADSLVYVTCEGNHVTPYKVYVVNTISNTVVDSIDVGRYPNGIAVIKP